MRGLGNCKFLASSGSSLKGEGEEGGVPGPRCSNFVEQPKKKNIKITVNLKHTMTAPLIMVLEAIAI